MNETNEIEEKEIGIYETKDAGQVKIINNGTHFIAYNDKNEAVSQPWVAIESVKDELGIPYEGKEPAKEVPKEETPEPTVLRLNGTLIDGTEVKCVKDKYHWRCFDANDKQVGEPFIKFADLEKMVGITLTVKKTAAAVAGKGGREYQDNKVDGEPICNEGKGETPEEAHEAEGEETADCEEGVEVE